MIMMIGCNPDGTDLKKAVTFYYASETPGNMVTKRLFSHRRARYGLLSLRSKVEMSKDEYECSIFDQCDSVSIVRQERRNENLYAIVQFHFKNAKGTTGYKTNTWIYESGKWRGLIFPKIAEAASDAMDHGDPLEGLKIAKEWIKIDPYSIEAYRTARYCAVRGDIQDRGKGFSDDEIIQAVMSINPDDSRGLFLAISCTDNPGVAKAFLPKLKGTGFYDGAAYNYAIHLKPADRIALFSELDKSASSNILRVITYKDLKRMDEVKKIVLEPGFEQVTRNYVKGKGLDFIASIAADLCEVAFIMGDQELQSRWVQFGLEQRPGDKQLKKWANAIEKVKRSNRSIK